MTKKRGLFLTLLGASALFTGGCGEIAYKTGAGADALQADQQLCKQSSGGPVAYKQCMNGKGWAIANLDAGGAQSAPAATAGSAGAAVPSASGTTTTSAAPDMAPPAADPAAPVPVTAWARFGSGDPGEAIAACVAVLGQANQPDKVHKTVTNALLACMRDKGWRGL